MHQHFTYLTQIQLPKVYNFVFTKSQNFNPQLKDKFYVFGILYVYMFKHAINFLSEIFSNENCVKIQMLLFNMNEFFNFQEKYVAHKNVEKNA